MSSTVAVGSGGNVMQLYDAKPAGTAKGAVIVLQEAFGITDYTDYIEDVGSVVMLAAARHPLGAAVTYYGGGVAKGRFGMPPLAELARELQTPWPGLFGKEDPSIPADQVELLRTEANNAGVQSEVVQYPGAGHAFHTDGRDAYHATSVEDAWKRTLDWLGAHLAKG
jgi:carboxymethylenebutenolidase